MLKKAHAVILVFNLRWKSSLHSIIDKYVFVLFPVAWREEGGGGGGGYCVILCLFLERWEKKVQDIDVLLLVGTHNDAHDWEVSVADLEVITFLLIIKCKLTACRTFYMDHNIALHIMC